MSQPFGSKRCASAAPLQNLNESPSWEPVTPSQSAESRDVEKLMQRPQRYSLPDISLNRDADHATPTHHFGEKDYESHRQTNLHIHHPLSQLPRKSAPRSKSAAKLGIPGSSSKTSMKSSHSGVGIDDSIGVIHEDEEPEEENKRDIPKFTIGDPDIDDDNPEVYEKESAETTLLVPTIVVEDEDEGPFEVLESKEKKHHHHKHHHRDRDQKHHHRHHHHHHHKHHHGHHHHHKQYLDPVDLTLRSQQGSHVELGKLAHSQDTLPTEEEEAKMLNPADLEEMTTHRFGEVPGMSRSKVKRSLSSFIHVSSKAGSDRGSTSETEMLTPRKFEKKKKKKSVTMKKEYDHRPHEVFVELDELFKEEGHEMQWKEKARWIKFEEDVEEGAHKWGKPHVASLSFHSLVELRHFLEEASCLMDLEEKDLPEIFHRIVDQIIISDQARDEDRGQILRTLLLKHKHLQDRPGLLKNISTVSLGSLLRTSHSEANLRHHKERNISADYSRVESSTSLHSNEKVNLRRLATEPAALNGRKSQEEVHIPMLSPEIENISNSNDNLEVTFHPATMLDHRNRSEQRKLDEQRVEGIMKKIPPDAEATTVLVGELDTLRQPAVVFVRLAEGTRLASLTEVPIPVRFLFVMLGPGDVGIDYHEIGRSFSTLMSNEHFHEVAYKADGIDDLLRAMNDFIDHTIVLPPGNWDKELLLPVLRMQNEKMMEKRRLMETPTILEEDEMDEIVSKVPAHPKDINPLKRTGQIFGGLWNDVKRRYPKYLSDIKDGLNLQCLAAFFFIYFATLSPAITFGGLLGDKCDNWMGVTEMMLGSSISGVIFSLFSAQPLTIIGPTGPVLVFEENLYQFCTTSGIQYLPYRAWVSLWLFIIMTAVVAFEGSTLVRYFTRFTEEIFAILISLIFIYEVFSKLKKHNSTISQTRDNCKVLNTLQIFKQHPLVEDYCIVYEEYENSTEIYYDATTMYSTNRPTNVTGEVCSSSKDIVKGQPNTALLSTILIFGTFLLAYFLRMVRNSRFLGREARKMIGDLGMPISILVFCLLDILVKSVYTQKLEVPNGLQPTAACKRGWIVNPMEKMDAWLILSAVIPALLVFILVYMETLITALILNKKENKLTKGSGFHLDLFILGALAGFNGIFGLPWMCSATVRSVTHMGALSIYSKSHAPGEKPRLEGVWEQRVTGFLVNLMIGLSIALAPLLRQVPITVLFGVFLYLGVSSLSGIQMVDRMRLIFMPAKHHPDVTYVRKVQTYRMHFFTVLQLLCLTVLWVVKISPAALAFPFFLILLVPVRMFLSKIFSQQELEALDGEEAANQDETDDEYNTTHMPF
ncbi:Anion exchange protein 2 [Holothuria leucospilota]|uniref:Anion exchange protein n=1 Tax=Holothuria leucospilota TaxID=206669 RepID=A0A9Q0YEL6_HOLLE|nr:Anion exchange protein 2 [Holothuria leucospilota]